MDAVRIDALSAKLECEIFSHKIGWFRAGNSRVKLRIAIASIVFDVDRLSCTRIRWGVPRAPCMLMSHPLRSSVPADMFEIGAWKGQVSKWTGFWQLFIVTLGVGSRVLLMDAPYGGAPDLRMVANSTLPLWVPRWLSGPASRCGGQHT